MKHFYEKFSYNNKQTYIIDNNKLTVIFINILKKCSRRKESNF